MPCNHRSGGLQVFTYEQSAWHTRCLCCGQSASAQAPGFPEAAGAAAGTALLRYEQGRLEEAARSFAEAAELSSDAHYHFASLLSRCGVRWCGDELQPTFSAPVLPVAPLSQSAEWLAIEQAVGTLDRAAYVGMCDEMAQLDEILSFIRAQEGRSACDVFLCYRRTSANVQDALRLYQHLTNRQLRVFCADITTRGKTQEQFESEVYHALRTAEYLVLLPGEGEDALTPWMHNELQRAACAKSRRMVCTTGHRSLSEEVAALGECLPLEEILSRLNTIAADCTPERLYERALDALRTAAPDAFGLLQRASAKGHVPARLLTAELLSDGLALPLDEERAAIYRQLAGDPSESSLRQVHEAFLMLEAVIGVTHREALILLVADVSDAGFFSSRSLAERFISALHADRLLSGAELGMIGCDRHARVLEEPKLLTKYGSAASAVQSLRTMDRDGSNQSSHAAKGLRCAADLLRQRESADPRIPAVILLRPCPTSDSDLSLQAARFLLDSLGCSVMELGSTDQIDECISRLRAAVK